jgi:CRP-like cAMP-binding protein
MLTSADRGLLRRSAILRDLPPADLAALVDERSVRSIERGHVLFQQGDPARAFFLVLSGQVKLSRVNPGGDEAVVHIYGAGESFAEAAMVLGGRYPVAAEAVVPSRVMHIESGALRRKVATRQTQFRLGTAVLLAATAASTLAGAASGIAQAAAF